MSTCAGVKWRNAEKGSYAVYGYVERGDCDLHCSPVEEGKPNTCMWVCIEKTENTPQRQSASKLRTLGLKAPFSSFPYLFPPSSDRIISSTNFSPLRLFENLKITPRSISWVDSKNQVFILVRGNIVLKNYRNCEYHEIMKRRREERRRKALLRREFMKRSLQCLPAHDDEYKTGEAFCLLHKTRIFLYQRHWVVRRRSDLLSVAVLSSIFATSMFSSFF